jgi:uncharacterized protein affecting Mg2+/Co2+ transport
MWHRLIPVKGTARLSALSYYNFAGTTTCPAFLEAVVSGRISNAQKRMLSTSGGVDIAPDKAKGTYNKSAATLRFYRILQRQCKELHRSLLVSTNENSDTKSAKDSFVLIQQPIDPHHAGGSQILSNITDASPSAILRLFWYWNEDLEDDEFDAMADWLDAVNPTWNETQPELSLSSRYGDGGCKTLWASPEALRQTIRQVFRHAPTQTTDGVTEATPTYVPYRAAWSIRAYQYLNDLREMQRTTSVSNEKNVRIVATSRCVGKSLNTATDVSGVVGMGRGNPTTATIPWRTRFAYRIRIENHGAHAIQVLGRTWLIQELLNDQPTGEPVRVHAPQTGAVGKLPVLHPGEAFEYMSGCELATTVGEMKGCFHCCVVEDGTPSAVVGQHVEAFQSDQRFEVTVQPFPLLADSAAS